MKRRYMMAMVLMTIAGVLSCFIPLFNILGYESAMYTGVVGGLVAMWLMHHEIGAQRPIDGTWSHAWLWFWKRALGFQILSLPVALLLLLNALRVTNCDLSLGALFWLLIASPAILIAQTLIWALAVFVGYTKKRMVLAVTIVIINALMMGLHIAFEPPITGNQWLIGFFSGSIYDEALSIPPSLLWYRLCNLVGLLGVVVLMESVRRKRAQPIDQVPQLSWRAWAGMGFVLLIGWSVLTGFEAHFEVRMDRETIAQNLGGRLETEHFIIHYPQHTKFRHRVKLLAEDHEFRYAEMKAFFKTDPVALHKRKVHSFVYLNREQKGQMMGARRTLIAKIWLREMHILWSGYGDHLLAHELAHIFTEPFGRGPLRLSARAGVFANMGLVEGIATAADNPPDDLSLHEASAAMRVLKIAPDIRRLVGAEGFWTQSSRRAYTLMGSFSLFLIDKYGIERYKKAYGGAEFQAAYNKDVGVLVSEWEAYVDGIKPRDEIMAIARFRYTRPSIFGKVCARTIAELKRKAGQARSGGDMAQAQQLFERIIEFQPHHTSTRIDYARLLMQSRDYERANKQLELMLKSPKLTPLERARLLHLRGDVRWMSAQFESAKKDYAACLKIGVPTSSQRLLQVKRHALNAPLNARSHALKYFIDRPRGAYLYDPMQWHALYPTDAVASYLVGRVLFLSDRWAEALAQFELASRGELVEVLRLENNMLRAQAMVHLRRLDEAQALLLPMKLSRDSRIRLLAHEWLARCEFLKNRDKKK